jgi:UDP-3-O-acyl-N-acetylglucosamine deacetylase
MNDFGRMLTGDAEIFNRSFEEFSAIPVDWDVGTAAAPETWPKQRTIESPFTLSGPGTFEGKNMTTVTCEPTDQEGWWFDRIDKPDELPIRVSVRNVWTTGKIVSNIVLRSGGPHNYVRMVEHIVAMKMAMGIENLMIRIDSGDPPLFDRGSMDLVDGMDNCGRIESDRPIKYFTVKEKVTVCWDNGQFLTLEPCTGPNPELTVDCAIKFASHIGAQRIKFPVTDEWMRYGAVARTNTPYSKVLYCKTLGKLIAEIRNLGYTENNVLIAKKDCYHNEPRLIREGKSLEAVWHRGVLDLLAAIALVEEGQFVGHITSFKAGHRLDVDMIKQLYLQDLLIPFEN